MDPAGADSVEGPAGADLVELENDAGIGELGAQAVVADGGRGGFEPVVAMREVEESVVVVAMGQRMVAVGRCSSRPLTPLAFASPSLPSLVHSR